MDYIECGFRVFHTKYVTHGNSRCEARGSSRYQNHSKRVVVRNIEERNVGTIREKVPNKAY